MAHALVAESDDYTRSVRGVEVDVIRTGAGVGPTEIQSAASPRWAGSSLHIGFPVFSRTTLSSDMVAVGVIEQAPPGMRWCGTDVARGDLLFYGPEADHVAVQPVGARFSYAVFAAEDLRRTADDFDSSIALTPGSVQRLHRSHAARRVAALLPRVVRGEPESSTPVVAKPVLVETVAHMLVTSRIDRPRHSRKLHDELIVQACIAHANRVARIPSIAELCEASHVSERRLHRAFVDSHGLPPHQFFITWALDIARRRLVMARPDKVTVAWIAMGSGFNHLGRFARYYRRAYGESPSTTLHRVGSLAEL